MAEERLGASFSIDVTQLKTGLAQANRLIRESQSEFKKAAASTDDWSKSETGLTAKIKSLEQITSLQKEKVRALNEQYQKLIDEGLDPTSARAVNLRTQINNEEAALKKNEAELQKQKEALEEVGKESEDAGKKAKKSGDDAEDGGKGWSKFGDIAKKAAKAAAAAIAAAGAAVVGITKEAIENYAEYEQLVGGVDTLFGESSKKVQEYAANAYKTAGLSANEYMETVTGFSASLLQSLGGDTEKAAKYADMAITDMSDNANKMGTDMEAISNAYGGFAKGNFTMLDNLKLGYGGTKEEMQRLLDDASKLPSAMGKKFDLSNYGDIVEAIHLVQEEMGVAGTTAKEASTTIQGSIASMKSAWSNMLTGLADENADIDSLITNLIDSVGTVIENVLPRITIAITGIVKMVEKILPQIAPLIKDLLPKLLQTIVQMLPSIVQAAIDIVIAVIDAVSGMLPELTQKIIEVTTQIINSLVSAVPQLLQAAVTLLMAIVQSIPIIIDALMVALPSIINTIIDALVQSVPIILDGAITLLMAIVDAIPTIITSLTQALPKIIDTVVNGLVKALPQLLQGAIKFLMAIIQAIPTIITALTTNLPKIISTITSTLINNLPTILKAAVQLFMGIIKAIPQIIAELVRQMPTIIKAIVSGLGAGMSAVADVGKNLIKGLWNGIKDMKTWIIDKVKGFGKGILDGLKNFFGIHSPSTVMEKIIGKNLALGIGRGFEKNIGSVNDEIQSAMDFDSPSFNVGVNANGGRKVGGSVVNVYQTNNYSQAHSRLELYKSKQQTAAAVRLAIAGV